MFIPHLIWLTGLSGSGKSTLANSTAQELSQLKIPHYRLDGDVLRENLCSDLGFSTEDRAENLRRAGAVAKILLDSDRTVIASFISPFQNDREKIRELVGVDNFIEIFVNCPLSECENRDVKGLYKKARAGKIQEFTGIDSAYEPPVSPTLVVNTHLTPISACIEKIISVILPRITGTNETDTP